MLTIFLLVLTYLSHLSGQKRSIVLIHGLLDNPESLISLKDWIVNVLLITLLFSLGLNTRLNLCDSPKILHIIMYIFGEMWKEF